MTWVYDGTKLEEATVSYKIMTSEYHLSRGCLYYQQHMAEFMLNYPSKVSEDFSDPTSRSVGFEEYCH